MVSMSTMMSMNSIESYQGEQIFSSCRAELLQSPVILGSPAAQDHKTLQKLCLGVGPRRPEEGWHLQRAGHFMSGTPQSSKALSFTKQKETSTDWSTTEGLL